MSDTAQEAIRSNNSDLIKRTRTTFKGKLTRCANILIDELPKDDSGNFKFKGINEEEVAALVSDLQRTKEIIEELHVRYTITRIQREGPDEDLLEKADEEYAQVFEKSYRNAMKIYHSYKTKFNEQELLESQQIQYPDKLRRFKLKEAEYQSALKEALTVVASKDEYMQRTASLQKELLSKEYSELLSMGQDLLTMLPNIPDAVAVDRESFECSKVRLTHRSTLTSLVSLIKTIEAQDKETLARVSPAPVVSGEVSATSVGTLDKDSHVIKI